MFYEVTPSKALRFGDILEGYLQAIPAIKEPNVVPTDSDYSVKFRISRYYVVMTPCCSIGGKTIALTPLLKVYYDFFRNPYFNEDLTRINREMEPQLAVSSEQWEKFEAEEQQRRLNEGIAYASLYFFIYEQHDLLPQYTLTHGVDSLETKYYMIDFRNIYKLDCDKVNSPKNAPLDSKVLELKVETRKELRDKLTNYFGRTPEEDKVVLGL